MNHALRRTALAVFGTGCVAAQAAPLPVIGWIEPVAVADGRVVVDAKIDTGADVSSLHVEGLRIERRGEEDWAVFAVPQASGPALPLERRVERYAQVKRVAGGVQRRPVVHLALCLGTFHAQAQVNLVDRRTMRYRMLIGRRFLRDRFLVDSARERLTVPACGAKPR